MNYKSRKICKNKEYIYHLMAIQCIVIFSLKILKFLSMKLL